MVAEPIKYDLQFKPRASREILALSSHIQRRILARIEEMSGNLQGDVKRLTNHTPEYRLRVGDYRVLFEVKDTTIIVYRVRHRKEAYR